MPLPRVFVTRIIPEAGLSLVLQACAAEVWQPELPPTREELLEHVRGVDGLLCLLTDRIGGEVMDAAGPNLKVISNHAVGYDNIDVPAATRRRLPVGNTPGILTDATADFAFALLVGIGVGTYSSIFVASPILLFFKELEAAPKTAPAAG